MQPCYCLHFESPNSMKKLYIKSILEKLCYGYTVTQIHLHTSMYIYPPIHSYLNLPTINGKNVFLEILLKITIKKPFLKLKAVLKSNIQTFSIKARQSGKIFLKLVWGEGILAFCNEISLSENIIFLLNKRKEKNYMKSYLLQHSLESLVIQTFEFRQTTRMQFPGFFLNFPHHRYASPEKYRRQYFPFPVTSMQRVSTQILQKNSRTFPGHFQDKMAKFQE